MKIISANCKFVSTTITKGKIHGQGSKKRYCFIILITDSEEFVSELYPGTYSQKLVLECFQVINAKLIKKGIFNDLWDIRECLHIPFISGNGIYQACVNATLNAAMQKFDPLKIESLTGVKYYYSGGTVKSELKDIEYEADYATKNLFDFYKIRLDYRNTNDCLEKIKFLNTAPIKFCVDFIANTNFQRNSDAAILYLIQKMDPSRVIWIEEPFVPNNLFQSKGLINRLRDLGFKVAIGESFTSEFELYALEQSGLADIVQLDATINADTDKLTEFARSCKKNISFHNWGSKFTSLLNLTIASKLSRDVYFEEPYYKTEFDSEISHILRTETSNQSISENENTQIIDIINRFSIEKTDDFQWT